MSGEHFRKLAAMGLSLEQIGGVMDMIDDIERRQKEADEARKAVARERVQRWRDKRNVTETLQERNGNATERLTCGDARGENNLPKKELTGKEERKKEAAPKALSDLDAFKADLLNDASPEQVEAFVKHRKAKNGQNSAYAAKLFRRDAAACDLSVSGAIDMAVSRGWLTVKPEYLAGSRRGSGQGPPSKPLNAVETNMQRRIRRNEPESGRRDNSDAELLPPDKPELRRLVVDAGQAMRWAGGSGNN